MRECAALQGFPGEWQFTGPIASRFRQVGNAVPSRFGKVLGDALLAALRSRRQAKPVSAPIPANFIAAIEYTRREHRRNGASRREVRERIQSGEADLREVKGRGSADCMFGV
jgi:DNA (cytosine-5)-methyltransferase 1